MIYSNKFIFIHIPRTGGTSLEEMFGGLPTVSKLLHDNKHAPASVAKSFIDPSIWREATKFTIYRDPWKITCSWYKHLLSMRDRLQDSTAEFREYCLRVSSLTFNEYLKQEIFSGEFVRQGGYLSHYLDCDKEQFLILDWQEAYYLLCSQTRTNPPIKIINKTKDILFPEDRKLELLEWCKEDMTFRGSSVAPDELRQRTNITKP